MSSARPMQLNMPFLSQRAAVDASPQQSGDMAAIFAAIYIFVIVSRLPELAAYVVRGNAYLALISAVVAFVALFFSGNLFKGFSTTQGLLLLALTAWMSLSSIFGIWRGGSFAVMTGLWVKSFMAFLLVAGTLRTLKHAHLMLSAYGLGTFLVVLQSIFLGSDSGDRFNVSIEGAQGLTLSNANSLALSLALGLPFGLYLVLRGKPIFRVFYLALILVGLVSNLRTGSRGGLLVSLILFILVFLRSALPQKAILLLGGGVFLAAAVAFIPSSSLERFKTLLGRVDTTTGLSAEESSNSRSRVLQESLRLTFVHPLFGVGPGNFPIAMAEVSDKSGERATWLETHNSYTKMSSETGVLGVLFFAGALYFSLFKVRGVEKEARLKGFESISDLCFCLALSLTALAVYNFFDSNALQYHLPVLTGLAAAIVPLVSAHIKQDFSKPGAIIAPSAPAIGYWRPRNSTTRREPSVAPAGRAKPVPAQTMRPPALQNWQSRRS